MQVSKTFIGLFAAFLISSLVGCAPKESALVTFSYTVQPEKQLPPGVKTIAIQPAKVRQTTDPRWQELTSTIVASLINDSRSRFNLDLRVTERRDTEAVFDEADLAAAGITGGSPQANLEAADAYVLSNVNVIIQELEGRQRTLAGLSLGGGGGHGYGWGDTDIRTEEVQTVTRNMTVQSEFKLVDARGNVWEHFSPGTLQRTDATKASPIFGSSRTAANLPPEDRIVYDMVAQAAQRFVSILIPCRIDIATEVFSSNNASCAEGVRWLRARDYNTALSAFESALAADSNDHRAAFGAGLACEATGQYDRALSYYRRATAAPGGNNPVYQEALDRVAFYGPRARPS